MQSTLSSQLLFLRIDNHKAPSRRCIITERIHNACCVRLTAGQEWQKSHRDILSLVLEYGLSTAAMTQWLSSSGGHLIRCQFPIMCTTWELFYRRSLRNTPDEYSLDDDWYHTILPNDGPESRPQHGPMMVQLTVGVLSQVRRCDKLNGVWDFNFCWVLTSEDRRAYMLQREWPASYQENWVWGTKGQTLRKDEGSKGVEDPWWYYLTVNSVGFACNFSDSPISSHAVDSFIWC